MQVRSVRVVQEGVGSTDRSRTYARLAIQLQEELRPTLACGPYFANTVAVAKGRNVFWSRQTDLNNLETFELYEKTIEHLKGVAEVEPEVIAHDLHPDYFGTRYALRLEGVEKIGVQHHHAHIASCLAENGVSGPVIGLAMDGMGYGTDDRLWGGEVLVADLESFERAGHFEYVRVPGGEAAIREPWRMAVSYLYHAYGEHLPYLPIDFVRKLDPKQTTDLVDMMEKAVRSPLTSSCGRLFDGIAALTGLSQRVFYRGQAAHELEKAMGESEAVYRVDIREDDALVIPIKPMIVRIVEDLMGRVDRKTIIRKFHNTLVHIFTRVSAALRRRCDLNRVALSGGIFRNRFLLAELERSLRGQKFEVLTHRRVPTNDGGVALGQAVVANAVLKKKK